ncbi:MAG: hypothetical protein V7K92_18075 [Nostoc sp.]|uniref:hypothetical protein n=1 Tax=Nostoc sp. TaxID=1180 RepID=UPI002FF0013A
MNQRIQVGFQLSRRLVLAQRKACGIASLREAAPTLRASLLPTALWASYGRR